MSKLYPASCIALLALATAPSGMRLQEGDTYEWQRRDMRTLAAATLRVTVLDKKNPTDLWADSGTIRRILVVPEAAQPETLQLFEFNDGELRWWSASRFFPVEFQSPQSVVDLKSGAMEWGGGVCLSTNCAAFATGVSTTLGENIAIIKKKVLDAATLAYADRTDSIHGIWTDSAGPIWFYSPKLWDFILLNKNGKSIGWTSPHLDSMESRATARADSIRAADNTAMARYDSIVNVLKSRQASMRFPRVGDRYQWRYLSKETEITGGLPDSVREKMTLDVTTTDAPADSSGWTRRTFEVVISRDSGVSAAMPVHQRWDSIGRVVSESKELALLASWSADSFQVVDAAGSYFKSFNGGAWPTYTSYSYLKTGELSSYNRSSPTFCSVTYPNSSQCKYYHSTVRDSLVLLSYPGGVGVAAPPDRTQSRDRLDIHRLRTLLGTDPDATVRWTTPSGRSGRESLSAFLGMPRRTGAMWIRVTTSHGRTFEATYLGM